MVSLATSTDRTTVFALNDEDGTHFSYSAATPTSGSQASSVNRQPIGWAWGNPLKLLRFQDELFAVFDNGVLTCMSVMHVTQLTLLSPADGRVGVKDIVIDKVHQQMYVLDSSSELLAANVDLLFDAIDSPTGFNRTMSLSRVTGQAMQDASSLALGMSEGATPDRMLFVGRRFAFTWINLRTKLSHSHSVCTDDCVVVGPTPDGNLLVLDVGPSTTRVLSVASATSAALNGAVPTVLETVDGVLHRPFFFPASAIPTFQVPSSSSNFQTTSTQTSTAVTTFQTTSTRTSILLPTRKKATLSSTRTDTSESSSMQDTKESPSMQETDGSDELPASPQPSSTSKAEEDGAPAPTPILIPAIVGAAAGVCCLALIIGLYCFVTSKKPSSQGGQAASELKDVSATPPAKRNASADADADSPTSYSSMPIRSSGEQASTYSAIPQSSSGEQASKYSSMPQRSSQYEPCPKQSQEYTAAPYVPVDEQIYSV